MPNWNNYIRNVFLKTVVFINKIISWIVVYGIKILIKINILNSYHPIISLGIRISPHREELVLNRWEAISKELPEENSCIMDIGSNLGFYCVECAKLGHLAIGVDMPNYAAALLFIRNALSLENIVPIGMRLTPDNINTLPKADNIIFLQVFHHLYEAYGHDSSLEMLKKVFGKCDKKLFFEVENIKHESSNDSLSVNYFIEFFETLGCERVEEIYKNENRDRSMLVVVKK
jgi:hypothetical protein